MCCRMPNLIKTSRNCAINVTLFSHCYILIIQVYYNYWNLRCSKRCCLLNTISKLSISLIWGTDTFIFVNRVSSELLLLFRLLSHNLVACPKLVIIGKQLCVHLPYWHQKLNMTYTLKFVCYISNATTKHLNVTSCTTEISFTKVVTMQYIYTLRLVK